MKKYTDIQVLDNHDGTCRVCNIHGFNLDKTIRSGQCFRFNRVGNIFTIQSKDKIIKAIQKDNDTLLVMSNKMEIEDYWIQYLGIDIDYTGIPLLIKGNNFLEEAEKFSSGLKIMKQNPWETLICFIISQRNNIPKIMSTVEKICRLCGKEVELQEDAYYTFPTPEQLIDGIDKYGEEMSLGYRLPYLDRAAKAVLNGELDLDKLQSGKSTYECALTELEGLYGVGPKVANCVALFGLGYTNAFPIDVWIQRVIDEYFDGHIDIGKFGEYAGVVQQYMFFYGKYLGK